MRARRVLRWVAPFLVAGSSVVLLADSAECPDGWDAKKYDATFTTTCAASIAAPAGEIHVDIGKGDGNPENAVSNALSKGRIELTGNVSSAGGAACVPANFTMQQRVPQANTTLTCERVVFDTDVQTVRCASDPSKLSFSTIRPRDVANDGGTDGSDAAPADAAPADAAPPMRPDAAAPAIDAGPGPVRSSTYCTFTFTRIR